MNIHSGGEELLHVGSWSDKRTDEGAEGRTDGHEEAYSRILIK